MSLTLTVIAVLLAVLALIDVALIFWVVNLSRIMKRLLASGPPPRPSDVPGTPAPAPVQLRPPALSLWHLPPKPGSSTKTLCGLKEHRALTETVYRVDCQLCRKLIG